MPGTPTPMPITTTNILGANGRLWLNVGLPTSGTPPGTLLLAPDGSPDSVTSPNALNVGATRSGVKLTTGMEVAQEEIDEQTAPYRTHIVKETAMMEGEMMETLDFAKLAKFVANGRLHTAAGYTKISAGGILTLAPMPIAVIAPNPYISGKFIYFMIYSAWNALGIQLNLTRRADTGMPFRFEGLGVPGRTAGDQLWQIHQDV